MATAFFAVLVLAGASSGKAALVAGEHVSVDRRDNVRIADSENHRVIRIEKW